MSGNAVMYFSNCWTTDKDNCYLVALKQGNLVIIRAGAYVLIEDEQVKNEVVKRMIEVGVKVISQQQFHDIQRQEEEARYDKWVNDGRPDIDISTRHQDSE